MSSVSSISMADGPAPAGSQRSPVSAAGQGKDVADDGLCLLVDAEDVAGYLAVLDGGVAGQHVAVKVLHQQPGAGAIVPVKALLP